MSTADRAGETLRNTQPPAVCAVDVGSSAVRAAVFDAEGTVLAQARRSRPSGQGAGEFDPEHMCSDVIAVLADVSVSGEIGALAIAGHVGTVVVDVDGEPVIAGAGWSDVRGAELLELATVHAAGRTAPTGGAIPLLRWLDAHQPNIAARAAHVLSPKDFLLLRLCDVTVTDHTSAAYTFGSDVRTQTWDPRLAGQAFPPQHAATNIVGTLTATAARRTGL